MLSFRTLVIVHHSLEGLWTFASLFGYPLRCPNGREYQHVNSSKTPNQDALYKTLNIYRAAMRLFIFRNLKEVQGLRKEDRIEKPEDFDIGNFPHLIRNYWRDIFEQCFDSDQDVRSVVGIITEARNKVAHPGTEDLPLEYAIGRLHDIADLLGRINAPKQKREVEAICEKMLTNAVTSNAAKQISEISEKLETSETQKKKYKENFEKADKQLKNLENEHNTIKEQLKTIQTHLTEVESQKRNAEEQLTTKTRDLKAAEDQLSENHVARPAIDIQTEKHPEVGYSEFWAPIRNGEFGELFAGKPVPIGSEGFISKTIRGVEVCLHLTNHNCYIRLWLYGENRSERRDKIKELFQESIYDCEDKDTPKGATLVFPAMNKGKNDRDDWDEIREKLVAMGTDIYNTLRQISALTPTQEAGRNIESSKTPPVLKGELEQTSSTPSTEKKGPAFVTPLPDLTDDEKTVFNVIEVPSSHIDTIVRTTQLPISQVSSLLLMLELKGAIQQLPGKQFTKGSV